MKVKYKKLKYEIVKSKDEKESVSVRKTLFPLKRLNHQPSSGPMIRFSAGVTLVLTRMMMIMNTNIERWISFRMISYPTMMMMMMMMLSGEKYRDA